jgi:hypothetical protein
MLAAFIDANASLAAVMRKLHRADDLPMAIHETPDITPDDLPGVLQGVQIIINDHTHCPLAVIKRCPDLKHIVFLGTGARSYMNPEELDAECGVKVHIIRTYHRLAEPLPAPVQGLGMPEPKRHRLPPLGVGSSDAAKALPFMNMIFDEL